MGEGKDKKIILIEALNAEGVQILEIYDPSNMKATLSYYKVSDFRPKYGNAFHHQLSNAVDITHILDYYKEVFTGDKAQLNEIKLKIQNISNSFSRDFSEDYRWKWYK